MKAIQFDAAIPRYALGLALGKVLPGILWSGLSCTYAADIPEPSLPTPEWLKIKTRYGGICGSDLGTIHLHTSPYYSPFSSFPFTLGHENTGVIAEVGAEAGDWQVGERVVVEPLLWCRPRGFRDLCPACARGEINRCERHTEGVLAPGLITGACRDTGGSWSPFFLAHASQVYRLPENISDENALMVEPFAVGLHAVLQNYPRDGETVLIFGAGTIGLCTLAALRALGSQAHTIVLARYPFQAQAAQKLGASEVILTRGADTYAEVARRTGAQIHQPILGKRVVVGGADRTFECVGSDGAIDDALRLTRSGGVVVLVGVPGIAKGIDWTAIFAQELTLRAANIYHHAEPFNGQTWKAFDLAIDLLARGVVDLSWMVTHKYALEDYATALKDLQRRGGIEAIKAVFAFPT
jgi:threonine dehydrogenase-like Zn-dependent dehydrogenase